MENYDKSWYFHENICILEAHVLSIILQSQ